MTERAPIGSVAGAIAGTAGNSVAPENQSFPIGPGAIIGGGGPSSPGDGGLERFNEGFRSTLSDVAALNRRSRNRPRLADEAASPPFPIGPGGLVSEEPVTAASRAAGVSERYLRALIGHESGGNPNAKANTSTATGHGQFIESTWLRMMYEHGERYGQPELARAIERTTNARGQPVYVVRDENTRAEILETRTDPRWAAIMAGEYARENEAVMRQRLNRSLSEGEVYLGHFLGADEAVRLIRAAQEDSRSMRRSRKAADVVSRAAVEANPDVFFDGTRARTTGEVVARQSRAFSRQAFTPTERSGERLERERIERDVIAAAMRERAQRDAEAAAERSRQRWRSGQPSQADLLLRAIMGR